jgi:DNA-binding GntR family transcriptional regulator
MDAPAVTPTGIYTLPDTMADHVLRAIRQAVITGHHPLGSHLDQQALADEYGVSTIPIRESLRQLQAEGLVKIIPRRGAFVVEFSPDELAEIFRIRAVLEELATNLAVARATTADLDALEALANELNANDDPEEWRRLNREWHFALYRLADAPLLLQLIDMLWQRCSLYRHLYPREAHHRHASAQGHARILQAFRDRDAGAASQALVEHVRVSAENVLAGIGEPSKGRSQKKLSRGGRPARSQLRIAKSEELEAAGRQSH